MINRKKKLEWAVFCFKSARLDSATRIRRYFWNTNRTAHGRFDNWVYARDDAQKKSCELAIHKLSRVVRAIREKEVLLVTILDIEGVFDDTPYDSIIRAEEQREVLTPTLWVSVVGRSSAVSLVFGVRRTVDNDNPTICLILYSWF